MSEPMEYEAEPQDEGTEQVADLPLSDSEVSPEPAPAAGAEPAAPAPRSWFDRHADFQDGRRTGFKERQRILREENRRFKLLEERHAAVEARNKELLATATELLRKQGGAGQAEEFPDPTLDPAGFLAWWKEQSAAGLAAGLDERLKPVLDFFEEQRQLAEGRAEQEAAARFVETEKETFAQALAEYQRDEPELAAGSEERFKDGQALLVECFSAIGAHDPAGYANRLLFSIAAGARATGDNEVAAMDGFISALYYGVSRRMVEAGFLQQPFLPAGVAPGNGAAVTGNGNGRQPGRRIMTEAQRQEEVRRRTAAAGSLAPREPSAGPLAARSEAQEMYDQTRSATGQVDWGKVRAAALRDTNGDEKAAAALLAGLRPSR